MIWTRQRILQELRRLHKAGKNLSYNALGKTQQPLLSAAAYHFGSYRKAVEEAGIDYADVLRRPRWSRTAIIALIKAARRKGDDLHWGAVITRKDELGKAAFASLQKRLFGKWSRALHAAGLDADDVARYRRWDKNLIAFEIKSRAADGDDLNSGSVQQDDPGLHAAAIRHFGSYDVALKRAKLAPGDIRRRKASKPVAKKKK